MDKKAEVLAGQLQHWYNKETGLWETTSWWNGANALTALIRFGRLTDNDSIARVVENTFLKTKQCEVPATENKMPGSAPVISMIITMMKAGGPSPGWMPGNGQAIRNTLRWPGIYLRILHWVGMIPVVEAFYGKRT